MAFAALFREAYPCPPVHRESIPDTHPHNCGHARKRIQHQADQCLVTKADNRRGVDTFDQLLSLGGGEYRSFPALGGVSGPPNGRSRIEGHDLAGHQIVEEHLNRREVLFDRRRGEGQTVLLLVGGGEHFDVGRDVDGADVLEFKLSLVRPFQEAAHRPEISFPRILVPDRGREELKETLLGGYTGADDKLRPIVRSEGQTAVRNGVGGGGRGQVVSQIVHGLYSSSRRSKTAVSKPFWSFSETTWTIPLRER